jgi:hypothetical protein
MLSLRLALGQGTTLADSQLIPFKKAMS